MIFEHSAVPGLWRGVMLAPLALLWIILLVRISGLRSFSKMTSFDFVVTLATGSLLASAAQATEWNEFVQSMSATSILFVAQVVLALARQHIKGAASLIDNEPVLLMENGRIFDHALVATRVSRADLLAKLRESNVLDPSRVKWAILEVTGDMSIVHGDGADKAILEGVRRI